VPGYSGGTSFSCPILAGCAASLWSAFPDKSAKEIKDAILITADRFLTPDSNYGYGIPNFYNAYLFLKSNFNKTLTISNDIGIFPNPFRDQLNVILHNETAGSHVIELYNLLGQKIFSKEVIFIRDNTYEWIVPLETNAIPKGEYILQLDGKKMYSLRVVKM
jgi:hypothetical protein